MSLSVGAFSVAVAFVSMQKNSQARTRRGSGDLKLAANNLLKRRLQSQSCDNYTNSSRDSAVFACWGDYKLGVARTDATLVVDSTTAAHEFALPDPHLPKGVYHELLAISRNPRPFCSSSFSRQCLREILSLASFSRTSPRNVFVSI